MNVPIREVHVEQLLGRRVRDAADAVVGRIEELRADVVDGEAVIAEYHIGPAAAIERIAGFLVQLPVFALLPISKWEYRVPWHALDLSDPEHPRLTVPRSDLRRAGPSAAE